MFAEYQKIEDRIKEIVDERENEIKLLEEMKEEAHETIRKANEDMLKATAAADMKSFKAAKAKKVAEADNVELYNARLELIAKEAPVSDEECAGILESVHKMQHVRLEEFIKTAAPLLCALEDAWNECNPFIEAGNGVLRTWGAKIKPFNKVLGYRSGVPVYSQTDASFTEHHECLYYMNTLRSCPQFEEITNRKKYEPEKPLLRFDV